MLLPREGDDRQIPALGDDDTGDCFTASCRRKASRISLRDDVVGGICTAHYGFSFVEIEPNPMVDWHNASGVTDSDADELAFLIGLLL